MTRKCEIRRKTPLSGLVLVQRILQDPCYPPNSVTPTYAVTWLMTNLVTSEFARMRRRYGRTLLPSDSMYEEVIREIQCDRQSDNPSLIGWSWLYHHYVTPDFNMHQEMFASHIGVDTRTLRRYVKQELIRLTQMIIAKEYEARQETQEYE